MHAVAAPDGFEGCVYFNDGTRTWVVAFRAAGDTYWTNCYLDAGHAHLTPEEINQRAEAAIRHALTVRGLIKDVR